MLPKLRQMYLDAKQVHHLLYEDLSDVEKTFNSPTTNTTEKADIVHALKQTSAVLDDLRKQIDKAVKRYALFTCIDLQLHEVDTIRTQHCTAKIAVKQYAKYPAKRRNDPDKFDKLMTSLGVPQDIIDSESVRLNWEGFSNWFTKRQADGLPLPDGITVDDVYTEYDLATRKLKEVDEE